jgi:hypothetical protein
MIDLPIVIYTVSFGIKITVGTSGNCENCVVGGEGIGLLRRFLDLWRRWQWWVGFSLDLSIDVV